MDKSKNAFVMISDDIYALRQLLNSIYFIQEFETAEKFKVQIDDLENRFEEKLHSEQNQISYGDFDDIITQTVELKHKINDYIQGEGKEVENRKLLEKYTLRLSEFSKKFRQMKSSELWNETQKIIEELKMDCEKNPLLEFKRFEKAIAKNVLQILIKQAKDGEKIDILKAQDFCSQFDLISIIHKRLIEMCNGTEDFQEKSKILGIASKLNENSLKDLEVWKLLTGIENVQIVLPETKKTKKLPINLPKLLGLSVYTLADIDLDTGEWINVEKKYGGFPRDFGDENCRVLQIEINGKSNIRPEDFNYYKNLRIANLGNFINLENHIKNVNDFKTFGKMSMFIIGEIDEVTGEKKNVQVVLARIEELPKYKDQIIEIISNDELELEKNFPELSIYTLGDIDEKTGKWINVRKIYGRVPIDFKNENERVLQIEVNGLYEIKKEYDLKRYSNLKRVILGKEVQKIKDNAFMDCENLVRVEIQRPYFSIENLGKDAFRNCNKLIWVKLNGTDYKLRDRFPSSTYHGNCATMNEYRGFYDREFENRFKKRFITEEIISKCL